MLCSPCRRLLRSASEAKIRSWIIFSPLGLLHVADSRPNPSVKPRKSGRRLGPDVGDVGSKQHIYENLTKTLLNSHICSHL